MDILVSSNLERLLYMLTGDTETRGYMERLNSEGRYTVGEGALAGIREIFSAGFCDDAATKCAISGTFARGGYLMDTHTAVAAKVLEDYRAASGDMAPAVIVSTASPFKFAADVLDALGGEASTDPLAALSSRSGLAVPAPLRGLETRELRFPGVTEKGGMLALVDDFLR